MTSTLSRRERFWVRHLLGTRDGQNCKACGAKVDSMHPLDIDHIDGNPTNNSPDNLRLLCRSCNTNNAIRRVQGIGTFLEREGEREQARQDSKVPMQRLFLKSKVNYPS